MARIKGQPSWWTNDYWATPPAFVRQLEQQWGQFDLDPCCTKLTAKAPHFYTEQQNGLRRRWFGRVFVNPPYSDPKPWCKRAQLQTALGHCSLVVMLLPCSFDTDWFHSWVLPYAELHLIRGRVRFLRWDGRPHGSPRQPNFLAVYRGRKHRGPWVPKPLVFKAN